MEPLQARVSSRSGYEDSTRLLVGVVISETPDHVRLTEMENKNKRPISGGIEGKCPVDIFFDTW